jgi:hypothetical protein
VERLPRRWSNDPYILVEVPVKTSIASGFIGSKGETVARVRRDSRCKIHVRHDSADKDSQIIEFKGTQEQVRRPGRMPGPAPLSC